MWLLEELLFVTLLSTVSAGPLPSVELLLVSKGPFTEEQTTEWAQSPAVDGGPVVNASKPVSEILLDLDQSTGLRQTRQVSPLQAMEQPYLYFVMRQFLVKIYPNGTGVQALRLTSNPVGNSTVLQQPNAIACDFDARDNVLIWSDVQLGAIYVAQEDGTNLRKVVDLDGGVADGLAWDWISKKLYWTDFKHKTIEVLDPSSGLRKLLFRTGNSSNPRAIVLDPTTRCMYLTDWGVNPAIQRASMDGTSLVNLHTTNLVWPNGLTIDYETQTLYWADAYLDKIECSSTDGSGRRTLITQNVLHPFGLTFCDGFLYWTDWMIRAVVAAPVTHNQTSAPTNFSAVISNLILDPMGIHMVSEEKQPLC